MLKRAAHFIIFAIVFMAPFSAQARPEQVRVENNDPTITKAQRQALRQQAAREYEKLKFFFNADVGPVTLTVRDHGVGRHVPPAQIIIPSRLIEKSRAITAHELTHLLTQGWASSLLKEGLAVYAQDKFGEQRGWPNFKQSVHRAAIIAINKAEPLVRGPGDANHVLSTRNPGNTNLRRAAYNVAGSWVMWIIEQRMDGDITRFMADLYRSNAYRKALGSSFAELRREWREFLATL
jgi:hypothetical protein